MAVYNSHNTKQWEELLNAINGGDTSAIATALTAIKTSIDSITTALSSLSAEIDVNSSQWANLINAITNQSLNVDLSNITSSVVNNLSNVRGSTVTDAFNFLNSIERITTEFLITNISDSSGIYAYKIGKILFVSGYIYPLQNLSAGTNIAKINVNPIFETFVCPVNDTLIKGGRFTLRTTGILQIESSLDANHWYSFSLTTLVN